MEGVSVNVLNPTDHLLHALLLGPRIQPTDFFACAIDVMLLLQAPNVQLDWGRLLAWREKQAGVTLVAFLLNRLKTLLDAPIPDAVLAQLATMSKAQAGAMTSELLNAPTGFPSRVARLWGTYSGRRPETNPLSKLAGLPRYLQHRWQLEHASELPKYMLSRARWEMTHK